VTFIKAANAMHLKKSHLSTSEQFLNKIWVALKPKIFCTLFNIFTQPLKKKKAPKTFEFYIRNICVKSFKIDFSDTKNCLSEMNKKKENFFVQILSHKLFLVPKVFHA
jgi:hypothetical protein